VGEYRVPEMAEKTRQMLAELYAPHNQRLFRFLGVESIPEWEAGYVAPVTGPERLPVTTSAREGTSSHPSGVPVVHSWSTHVPSPGINSPSSFWPLLLALHCSLSDLCGG
jgi:hypothetical protein